MTPKMKTTAAKGQLAATKAGDEAAAMKAAASMTAAAAPGYD